MSLWRQLRAAGAASVLGGALCAAAATAAEAAPAIAAPSATAPAGGPAWSSLTPAQQQILGPLQRDWASIEPNRKQKWLQVAARFPTLPADERLRLQQRMSAWASLTPAERARARMQYQEARQLPAEERQARWQAYQALSDDERKTLVQRAKPVVKAGSAAEAGSAAARARATADLSSTSSKRNMVVPTSTPPGRAVAPTVVQAKPGATTTSMSTRLPPPSHNQAGLPKIAATPGYVDSATLLPRRGAQGAAVRASAASDPTSQP